MPRPRMRHLIAAAAVIVSVGATLCFAVAVGVVRPDAACGPCHEGSGVSAAHADTACYGCHAGPGWAARTSRVVIDVAYALRGVPDRLPETAVPNAACLRCHRDAFGSAEGTVGVNMNHYACLRPTAWCTDCHSDAGHGRVSGDRTPSMDRCSRCHDGTGAPKTCETCHADGAALRDQLGVWAESHRANRHETTGSGEPATCLICHDRRECTKCHLAVPHSPAWPTLHGSTAIDLGAHACDLCHTSSMCYGCHRTRRPHPADWLARHGARAPLGGGEDAVCRFCHATSDCTDCHDRSRPGASQPGESATAQP